MIRRLWPFALGAFALGLDAYVLAGLLPAMAGDLHVSPALAGLGIAAFTAAYAVSAPLLASAASRYSTRLALLAGLSLFTLGNVATMAASSLAALLCARTLAGVGAGLYSPLASSSAAGMVADGQRGRALSMVLAGLSIGTAFGVPMGLSLAAWAGWRWTMGVVALLGMIAALGIVLGEAAYPESRLLAWRSRFAALKQGFTLATLAVTLLTGAASLGLYTYLAEIAAATGTGERTGTLIWLWGLGGMSGALLIGKTIDQYLPPPRATLLLLGLLAIGFALVECAHFAMAAAGCYVWGLAGWASIAPQQHALLTRDPDNAAASVAWNSSANYLGGALGAAGGAALLAAHFPASLLPAIALSVAALAGVAHCAKRGMD